MKNVFWLVGICQIFGLVSMSQSQAAMKCQQKDEFGKVTISLAEDKKSAEIEVTNQVGIKQKQKYLHLVNKWDRHMTGIVTGKGLSIKYEDHYGCFKNVSVQVVGSLGAIEEVPTMTLEFEKCSGGTTSDELCGV